MKKLLALLMVAMMLLSMTACQTAGGDSQQKYVVGICQLVQHDALDAATQGFMDTLKAKLEAEGKTVEFKYENAQGDSNTCNTIF